MPRTIRVLWIEDKPSKTIEKLTSIVEKEVKVRSYKFELYNALEVATAVDIMKNNYIDIIFSDFNLSKGKNGLEYLNE